MKKILLSHLFLFAAVSLFAQPAGKPTQAQIAADMVGRTLSEGYEDGWFDICGWTWTIEKGEIESLSIARVLIDTDREYCILAKMRLRDDYKAFDATVKISYVRTRENRWKLEYAASQGMDFVKTDKYRDCISCRLAASGGNPQHLYVTNKSDISLGVAIYLLIDGKWRKSFREIASNSEKRICVNGSPSCGEDVSDYRIAFVMNVSK